MGQLRVIPPGSQHGPRAPKHRASCAVICPDYHHGHVCFNTRASRLPLQASAEDPSDLTFREPGQGWEHNDSGSGAISLLWLLINRGSTLWNFLLGQKQNKASCCSFLSSSAAAVPGVSSGAEASCVPDYRPEATPQGTTGPT